MRNAPRLSTLIILLCALGIIAVQRTAVVLGMGGANGAALISDVGEAFIVLGSGVIILLVALGLKRGEPLRGTWGFLGLGVLAFGIGDVLWGYAELVALRDTFPSAADVAYLVMYVCFGIAFYRAVRPYHRLLDLRGPAVSAAAVVCVLAIMETQWLILPYLLGRSDVSTVEALLSIFYPIADLFVCVFPVLMLLFISGRLGAGALTRPWWPVAIGVIAIAVSDILYLWLDAIGRYEAGSTADYGWMLGHLAIAYGALMVRDLAYPPVPYVRMAPAGDVTDG